MTAEPHISPNPKHAENGDLKPYESTVLGLLRKRLELLGDADRLRQALSANMEDIRSLDRTLRALGHKGDLKRMTPAGRRQVVFHRDFATYWISSAPRTGRSTAAS
jgi:hypothetical protein